MKVSRGSRYWQGNKMIYGGELWDEPLNYIDVFSRMQIEKLILQYKPTMLLVEHDVRFREKVGTGELTW